MSTSKWLYWSAQCIGWLSYSALIFLATYARDPKEVDWYLLVNLLAFSVISILMTHAMRWSFIKLNWLDMKLTPLIPRLILLSLLCSVCISLSSTGIHLLLQPEEITKVTFLDELIDILAILVLILLWNGIYFTFHFFQKSKIQELNNLSLVASRNEIELKNLRSQLNPHFLFNSLNSIRALIDLEPVKAKESVTTLSNLLRKSLILGKENLVRLEEELEMVSNYLELEKIRFEERLVVKWIVDDSLNEFLLPPFSLQMLVENAIKHGISNLMKGGMIIIETKQIENKIIISVSNSGQISQKIDTGIGIENTKRRLALQFGDSAEFELLQKEELVVAQLIFTSHYNS